ncbi:dihydroorotase [Sedimenticola selenatireducens]|uniref:Dihydroorotase n=1 Tax=Sedimenticola selenatireducens TaxID=191960 RepID=A0A2N6CSI3_9GAMM|nr:dihydroorotase [Sedimenticola selenatireducens]PLX60055.1 MAG: dihydroorotase [Sedimenticola selenatireducens]
MAEQILIKNASMVNDGRILQGDLLIRNGRIEQISPEIAVPEQARVLDAEGHTLIPGMIDDQVHFREPGATHKGDMRSESRAAVAGGITSFMDMPNTNPQTTTRRALEEKYVLAADRSLANYAFYLGATNDNLDEIVALDPKQACGIKVFMGASTGNMLVNREEALEAIFRDAPLLVATHCEDTPTIQQMEEAYREKYGEDVPMECHPEIRSVEACYLSSSMAVELAKKHDTRLHVLHLTTAREMELFEPGPPDAKRITAEACVHHLYFDDRDYARKGSFIKCTPAVKSKSDRDALRKALVEGRIDVVATDHAPHTLDEKLNSYFKAPAGLPLVQWALPMMFELYHDRLISLEQLVEKTSHAPARLFNVSQRGYLREGYWADLALVDLNNPTRVERRDVLYKCGWSPMEGERLRSRIVATFVNGQMAYRNGRVNDAVLGRRLEFDR